MQNKQYPLLVGLGNWGEKYQQHRHNIGHAFIRQLAAKYQAHWTSHASFKASIATDNQSRKYILIHNYMNTCGLPLKRIVKYFDIPINAIYIAHDELDLPCGTVRLKQGGGHGGHNGLRDLIAHLGADFRRIRIGIDHPGRADQVTHYVLSKPNKPQQEAIENAMNHAIACSDDWLCGQTDRWNKALQYLHTKPTV